MTSNPSEHRLDLEVALDLIASSLYGAHDGHACSHCGSWHTDAHDKCSAADLLRKYGRVVRIKGDGTEPADTLNELDAPRWKHDCDKCVFLGRLDSEGDSRDLYVCPDNPGGPAVCARWGGEGCQHSMGGVRHTFDDDIFLGAAWKRAWARGLISKGEDLNWRKASPTGSW